MVLHVTMQTIVNATLIAILDVMTQKILGNNYEL
jgi:hypothetical protein